jgi:hypothetical protein
MLRHIVLFRFKPEAMPEGVARVEQAFNALPATIATIRAFAWGTDNSPEGLAHGYTHAWTLDFDDAAARDAYLVHPDHVAFTGIVQPVLDAVLVFDHDLRTK